MTIHAGYPVLASCSIHACCAGHVPPPKFMSIYEGVPKAQFMPAPQDK